MGYLREYSIPVIVALLLHALVLLSLGLNFTNQAKLPEVPTPKFITAAVVKLEQKAKTPVQPDAAAAAAQKQRDTERKRAAEQKRQEQQRQERLKQEQLKAEQAKQRQQQEIAKKKAEQERLQQEKAKKAQQEKLRQQQIEQEKIKQAQQEALAQRAREDALLKSIETAQQAEHNRMLNEQQAQSYAAVIQQAVIAQWSRPASARNGMEVLLDIQLIPNGTVISVTVAKSSGNDAFDRSAVAAVKKAERFPELAQMDSVVFEQYFRNFRMRFNPEDLRL